MGVVLAGFFITRSLLRPMIVLSGAMRQVSDGRLDVRAPVTSNDELGAVTGRFNTMVEGLRERERIRETFGRYVDESVATAILQRGDDASGGAMGGEIREATILFTDIAGFTTIAEYLAPAELVAALNEYLETVLEPIRRHGGVVNTFIGDGLFASFNMPLPCADHPCAAVRAAIDIQRAVGARTFGDQGVALATRIGISTGPGHRRLDRRGPAHELHPAGRHGEPRRAAGGVEQAPRHAHSGLAEHARRLRRSSSRSTRWAACRCAAAASASRSSVSIPTGKETLNEHLRSVARSSEAAGPRAGTRQVARSPGAPPRSTAPSSTPGTMSSC